MGNASIKNLTTNEPNKEAKTLIDQCSQMLATGFLETPGIYSADQDNLERLSAMTQKAKVIVHKDIHGATIISSTGSITVVGNENVKVAPTDYDLQKKVKQTKAEFDLAMSEIVEMLKDKSILSAKDMSQLQKLDDALEDIVIVVSEDGKKVIIADSFGKYQQVTSQIGKIR